MEERFNQPDSKNKNMEKAIMQFHAHLTGRNRDFIFSELKKDIREVRMEGYRYGLESIVVLSRQMDSLLSALEGVSRRSINSFSRLEYNLLVQACDVILKAAQGTVNVPRMLTEGLQSCIAIRNHELDYLTTPQWGLSSPIGSHCYVNSRVA